MRTLAVALAVAGCSSGSWQSGARILVQGDGVANTDCRGGICQHNENTDLTSWRGALWLVHRTARSQVLGPDSALHVYRSTDGGASFADLATVEAPLDPILQSDPPGGRDLRDPHFFTVGDTLHIKALTRLPVTSTRDSDVQTVAVETHTTDGTTWSPLAPIGPAQWSYWRPRAQAGTWYTAAYHDGDSQVTLFSSTDGVAWTRGADVYTVSADTPLETELTFLPSGRMLALVRMDGTDAELLGASGRLRTAVCWSQPPYSSFDCPQVLDGVRLDGPLTIAWNGRIFVVARKHLPTGDRKRTALYELNGTLDGGPLTIREWGELPSAGDTAYAGGVALDDHRFLVSWYSSALYLDESWIDGILDASDIWTATLDLQSLQ